MATNETKGKAMSDPHDCATVMVVCHDCGRKVPMIEATEQTTFEGTHIRCEPCGDAAYIRAWDRVTANERNGHGN